MVKIEKKLNYTRKEVAEMLGVDVRTVDRYIKRGTIKAIRLSAQTVLIPITEIEYLFPKES